MSVCVVETYNSFKITELVFGNIEIQIWTSSMISLYFFRFQDIGENSNHKVLGLLIVSI